MCAHTLIYPCSVRRRNRIYGNSFCLRLETPLETPFFDTLCTALTLELESEVAAKYKKNSLSTLSSLLHKTKKESRAVCRKSFCATDNPLWEFSYAIQCIQCIQQNSCAVKQQCVKGLESITEMHIMVN